MMDAKTLKAMVDRLQKLADGAEPINRTVGICFEAAIIAKSCGRDKVAELCIGWPEFSGNEKFPVPSHHPKWTAEEAFFNNDILWDGEYGAARRRLCGFLAQEVRKELKEKGEAL